MEVRKVQEPYPMFGPGSELFPESPERPEGARSVSWPVPEEGFMMDILPDIVYQSLSGEDQHLQICLPLDTLFIPVDLTVKRPLVVYVPGSAWHKQSVWKGLDKARYFVAHGYIFAIVEYRPSDVAPFPAQIRDAEAAVRFLTEHAEEYHIDLDRVALWGDSSGGHTVVSLAAERPELARCVVDWYAPMDNVVPFNQSVRLYEKLRECGKETLFYRVEGSGNGTGGFTSREALETTFGWVDEHLH